MPTRPTDDIEWGTDGAAEIAEPSSGEKELGWVHGTKPPAHWFNWLYRAYWRWIVFIDETLGLDSHLTALIAGDSSATRESLTVTASATNKGAIKGTGKGSGAGVAGFGDTSGGGVEGTGGSSSGAIGVKGVGGSTNGVGVRAEGVGTGLALSIAKGGSTVDAASMNGMLVLTGAAPNTSDAISNRLTPVSFIKAWGLITLTAGSPAVTIGHNITSVTTSGNNIRVTMASSFTNSTSFCPVGVLASNAINGFVSFQTGVAADKFDIAMTADGGGTVNLSAGGSTSAFFFVVVGPQ